jgi:hypothetical protein
MDAGARSVAQTCPSAPDSAGNHATARVAIRDVWVYGGEIGREDHAQQLQRPSQRWLGHRLGRDGPRPCFHFRAHVDCHRSTAIGHRSVT